MVTLLLATYGALQLRGLRWRPLSSKTLGPGPQALCYERFSKLPLAQGPCAA